MAGCADDESFLVGHAKFRRGQGRVVETEIDHRVGPNHHGPEIVPEINRPNHLQLGIASGTRDQCLPHPPLSAVNNQSNHNSIEIRVRNHLSTGSIQPFSCSCSCS